MDSVFASLGGGIRFNPKVNKDAATRGWSEGAVKPLDFFQEQEQKMVEEVGPLSGAIWEQKVKVSGVDAPNPFQDWAQLTAELKVRPYLVKNIEAAGYPKPTPVQAQVIPAMMKSFEVLVSAPTGSGKTASYLIPLFHLLNKPKSGGIRAIIIIPTRELAKQIEQETNKLTTGKPFRVCTLTQVGGKAKNLDRQESNVIKNADLLITTPARIVRIIQSGGLNLNNVQQIVLDEADQLLSDNFIEQMDVIVGACQNPALIVNMFSATISPAIESLANSIMKSPLQISVGVRNAAVKNVKQSLLYCGDESGKLLAIRERIRGGIRPPVLIFVQTKERANALFRELVYDDINVDVITGERTDAQRDEIILQFRKGKIWFLIATDLMARGIDFKGVALVINYDMPESPTDYIHRVGRTGRMGVQGEAITYYTDHDVPVLRQIVNVLKNSEQEVPEWLQNFTADKRLMEKLERAKDPYAYDQKQAKKRMREEGGEDQPQNVKKTENNQTWKRRKSVEITTVQRPEQKSTKKSPKKRKLNPQTPPNQKTERPKKKQKVQKS